MVKKTKKKLDLNTATVRKLHEQLTDDQLKQADGGRSGTCSMDACGTREPGIC